MCFFYLDFDITSHKILFEDKKLNGADQQIKFCGTPFVILGSQLLDCIHGVDHKVSRKKKQINETKELKVQSSF